MLYVFSSFLTSMHEYVYDGICPEVVLLNDILEYPHRPGIKKLARRILLGRVPLPESLLLSLLKCGERERSCLRRICPQDKVLVFDLFNPMAFKALLCLLPQGCKVYVYFSNPLERCFVAPKKILEKFHGMGAICCSFDPRDAERYNIRMAGQYFFRPSKENVKVCNKNNCQAFFCGLEKDRAIELSQIKSFLQSHHIQCDFHIPKKDTGRISFKHGYLLKLSHAGIVVDINQQGQSGLTRRPIEALLWNKKLVTNNKDIVNYDFYTPENIFVYGVDDPAGFERFVETPLTEVPEAIKSRYTVAGWLEQFL